MTDSEAVSALESKAFANGVLATRAIAVAGRSVAASSALGQGGALVAGGYVFAPIAWGFAGFVLAAQRVQ